jgi:MerR family copper efflux transcriptional regulator
MSSGVRYGFPLDGRSSSVEFMKIGELGDQCGVTAKTIRYYESIGLLDEPSRTPSGYRDYGEVAVERLRFIRDAQSTGLSLAEISSVLELKGAGERSCAHTMALIGSHLLAIDAQIDQLTAARRELATLAKRAKGLDPVSCTDPNRCQVIDDGRHTV